MFEKLVVVKVVSDCISFLIGVLFVWILYLIVKFEFIIVFLFVCGFVVVVFWFVY